MRGEPQRVLARQPLGEFGVAAFERLDDAKWSTTERAARLSWWIVILRIARMWMNRFSVISASSAQPLILMIAW